MSTEESQQVFVVTASDGSSSRPTQFLIQAPSHRSAWRVARQTCRTGQGGFIRDPATNELEPFPITPGALTVSRVLSVSTSRRGRPPKITTDDLLAVAEDRGVKLSPKLRRVLQELNV